MEIWIDSLPVSIQRRQQAQRRCACLTILDVSIIIQLSFVRFASSPTSAALLPTDAAFVFLDAD